MLPVGVGQVLLLLPSLQLSAVAEEEVRFSCRRRCCCHLRRLWRRAEREDVQPTAVVLAARNGDTASVQALVREGGVDVNASGEYGRTALFEAARNGHTETVRALEACGADVESADVAGETPLFAAASQGKTKWEREREQS